jgi:uncharacterized protein DUF1905/bacteriocin resistance YdeI/OmpD-like protein
MSSAPAAGHRRMTFRATIQQAGKTATGIVVPPDVIAALGTSRKPAVRVTIRDHTYRSTVATRGGEFKIPLSAENRTAAGVAAGDEVDVTVALDTEPRVLAVPPDLLAAFERHTAAARAFDALSYSAKQRYVLPIATARTSETRERNGRRRSSWAS